MARYSHAGEIANEEGKADSNRSHEGLLAFLGSEHENNEREHGRQELGIWSTKRSPELSV